MLVIWLALAVAASAAAYRLLVDQALEQTSLLFIGIPTLLAVMLAMAPPAGTGLGVAMRTTTFALLFSGIALGEGFICVIMAAPLFYLIVYLGFLIVGWFKSSRGGLRCAAWLPLILMSFEGVTPDLSFAREEQIARDTVIAVTPEAFANKLSQQLDFDAPVPTYLRMGFPQPIRTQGDGLEIGDTRVIHMAGGEGEPGDLTLEVAEKGDRWVRFRCTSDTSHVSHWLDWRDIVVTWQPEGLEGTRVHTEVRYTRRLDPGWYFGPWERYAVGLAADFAIASIGGQER